MQDTPELETEADGYLTDPAKFTAAVTTARLSGGSSWVIDPDGKRIAALVPVEVLEFYRKAHDPRIIAVGRHRQTEPAQS